MNRTKFVTFGLLLSILFILVTTVFGESSDRRQAFVTSEGGSTLSDSAWVTPSSLYLTASEGSTTPVSQPVLLQSTVGPTPYESYVVGGDSSFVSVYPPSGITNDSLQIVINPTGMPVGYHHEWVIFRVDGVSDSVLLPVTLEIIPDLADTVWIDPSSIFVTADNGSTDPISRIACVITTTSPTTYEAHVMGGASSFVTVYPLTGFTHDSLQVVINPSGLEVGYHSDTVVFEVTGFDYPVLLGVTLQILPQPEDSAWVEPPNIYVSADSGSTDPITRPILLLTTIGPTPYESYVVGGLSSFVSVYPPSGITHDSLVIVIEPAGLGVGYHSDSVVFHVTGIGDSVLLPVLLEILPQPIDSAWVTPSYIYVTADSGSTDPISRPIWLLTTTGPTPYESYVMGGPSSFLTVYPPSGFTHDSLQVVMDPTGLDVGYHCDTVVFEVTGFADPVLLGVDLLILPEPDDSVWLSDDYQEYYAPQGVDSMQYGGVIVYSSDSSVPFTVSLLDDRDMVCLLDTAGVTNDLIAFEVYSTADMPVGVYVDTLLFTFAGGFDPEILVACLTIDSGGTGGDSAWVWPSSLSYSVEIGNGEAIQQTVALYSTNAPAFYRSFVLGDPYNFVTLPDSGGFTHDTIQFVVDPAGLTPGLYTNTIMFEVSGVSDPVLLELELELTRPDSSQRRLGNYPNPFNPSTNIVFSLSRACDVRLEVFNIMGQRIAMLVNQRMEAGEHIVPFDGSKLASGIYLYRLQTDELIETRKMTLMK